MKAVSNTPLYVGTGK